MHKSSDRSTMLLNIFPCGFFLFYIGYLLNSYVFINNKMFTRPISLLGILLVLWGTYKIKKTTKGVDNSILPVYYFFMTICILNVIVGVPLAIFDGTTIGWLFDNTFWMYLIGFAMIIPMTFGKLRIMLKWAMIYVITAVAFSLFNFGDFYLHPTDIISNSVIGQFDSFRYNRPQEPGVLLAPIGAFLIFFSYFSRKWKFLIIIGFVLAIMAALLQGRRSISIITLCYPLISIVLYYNEKKNKMILLLALLSLGVLIGPQILARKDFNRFFDKNFVVLSERLEENTRDVVHDDFYKDMKEPTDWIFGRGMSGTYRSVQLSHIGHLNRSMVETGFLNIILHGGVLMLLPYIIILLYSFYKGFFFSNNIFVKSCSAYVLFHLFLLIPGGHLRFTYECFILFIFIRICTMDSWRRLSNKDILKIIESSSQKNT